jgi:hypothetical protein
MDSVSPSTSLTRRGSVSNNAKQLKVASGIPLMLAMDFAMPWMDVRYYIKQGFKHTKLYFNKFAFFSTFEI